MKNESMKADQPPRFGEAFTALAANRTANTMLQTTLLQRTETILRMQSNFFDSFETLSRHWLEHRQDDIRSALSTVEQMGAAEDAAERSSLWNEWMTDRFKRWSGEATELAEQAQALSRALADQTSATAERPFQPREAGVRRERKAEGAHG